MTNIDRELHWFCLASRAQLHRCKRRFLHSLFSSDMLTTRLTLVVGAFIWAALLFWPGTLFTDTRTTYKLMAHIASEEVWGALFFIQGTIAAYTLFANVRSNHTLAWDAILGAVLWTVSTLACFLAHYQNISTYQPPAAMSGEVALMIASWWHLVRHWATEEDEPCKYS